MYNTILKWYFAKKYFYRIYKQVLSFYSALCIIFALLSQYPSIDITFLNSIFNRMF